MSLDVYLIDAAGNQVYGANITHNLNKMADAAGIYQALWRPEEIGITKAAQLIDPLRAGLHKMVEAPSKYSQHDDANGWGTYEQFVPWVARYLEGCINHPDATVNVWR